MMNVFEKSASIKVGLRQNYHTGASKIARRKCYGFTVASNGELIRNHDEDVCCSKDD